MHLVATSEQAELKAAVRRFCEEQINPTRLAAWQEEPSGIDPRCWQAVADLGWLGLAIPTRAGGSGLGLVEIACLLEECARGLVPRRVINSVRGALALTTLDPDSQYLPALAPGTSTVALAFDEAHGSDPTYYETDIIEIAGTPHLQGQKCYVPDAATADLHLVAAREGDGVSLVLVQGASAACQVLRTFDGDRQAQVRYSRVPILQRLSPAGQGANMLRRIRHEQRALALAEMVGGMDAALSMTVAYVKDREQFGQKLAVFQAVQHQIADMAIAHTAARHLAWQAITRIAAGTEEGVELATAAAFVGQAFKRLSLAAHHLHGGAGYVVEHPLHYHAERAQTLCIRYAPEAAALSDVAARLLE